MSENLQARNQGGARGAFAPPTPSGPKGPHFDTQVKEYSRLN